MGTTAAQKKLFFNLRRMKNQIEAFEDGDLKPEDVTKIATDLGVSEEDVISMNRRMAMGGDTSLNVPLRDDRRGPAGRISWSTANRCRTSASPTPRRARIRHDLLVEAMERAQRARAPHPDRAAADRRAQDARGAEPGLRRQPRAHPPDRGPGVREAAEGADEPRRRAAAADRRLGTSRDSYVTVPRLSPPESRGPIPLASIAGPRPSPGRGPEPSAPSPG